MFIILMKSIFIVYRFSFIVPYFSLQPETLNRGGAELDAVKP